MQTRISHESVSPDVYFICEFSLSQGTAASFSASKEALDLFISWLEVFYSTTMQVAFLSSAHGGFIIEFNRDKISGLCHSVFSIEGIVGDKP